MNIKPSNMFTNQTGQINRNLLRKQDMLDKKREELEKNPRQGDLQQIADNIRMSQEQNKLNAMIEKSEKQAKITQGKKKLEQEKERLESMADPKMAEFMLRMEMVSKDMAAAATPDEMTTESADLDINTEIQEELQIHDEQTLELKQEGKME